MYLNNKLRVVRNCYKSIRNNLVKNAPYSIVIQRYINILKKKSINKIRYINTNMYSSWLIIIILNNI